MAGFTNLPWLLIARYEKIILLFTTDHIIVVERDPCEWTGTAQRTNVIPELQRPRDGRLPGLVPG